MAESIDKWLKDNGLRGIGDKTRTATDTHTLPKCCSHIPQHQPSRLCPRCKLLKPICLFTGNTGLVNAYCHECMRSYSNARYQQSKLELGDCVICGEKSKLETCKRCKSALELFRNDVGILSKALAYLIKSKL